MKLTEFERGTSLIITSTKQDKHRDFTTDITLTVPEDDIVYAKPIVFNGRMIRFKDPEITHVVTVNAGSKVYAYHDVKVETLQMDMEGHKYTLRITAAEDAKPVNRRSFFRVFLGVEGVLETEIRQGRQEVVVKDVSANGIGVICSNQLHIPVGMEVFIDFVDELTGEEFKINCVVVRRVKNDEQTIIYGCQLPESNDSMEKFVALKQRLR